MNAISVGVCRTRGLANGVRPMIVDRANYVTAGTGRCQCRRRVALPTMSAVNV